MDKEERKEYLRYRVWLYQHASDVLRHHSTKKGYSTSPNRDYFEALSCRECKQPFQKEVPWQKRCDNCIKSEMLEGGSTHNEYKVTALKEVFNGGILRAAETAGDQFNGDAGKRIIHVARTGSKICKKCGGSIFQPTYGCDGCYSYKEIVRANPE